MKDFALLIEGDSYIVFYEDSNALLRDMDIESELIAYKLSGILAPFSLFIMRQLLRDMRNLEEIEVITALEYFQTTLNSKQYPPPSSVRPSLLLSYMANYDAGSYYEVDMDRDLQEWFVECASDVTLSRQKSFQLIFILSYLLSDEQTDIRVLELSSKKLIDTLPLLSLLDNPHINDFMRENILRREKISQEIVKKALEQRRNSIAAAEPFI